MNFLTIIISPRNYDRKYQTIFSSVWQRVSCSNWWNHPGYLRARYAHTFLLLFISCFFYLYAQVYIYMCVRNVFLGWSSLYGRSCNAAGLIDAHCRTPTRFSRATAVRCTSSRRARLSCEATIEFPSRLIAVCRWSVQLRLVRGLLCVIATAMRSMSHKDLRLHYFRPPDNFAHTTCPSAALLSRVTASYRSRSVAVSRIYLCCRESKKFWK